MKRIGMLVAVEITAVLDRYGHAMEMTKDHGYVVLTYATENAIIDVINCGVGEIAAAAGTQFLICARDVDMIVNFGVVGGLTPEMTKAHTCVVDRVVHYDFDTSPVDPVKVGEYPDQKDEYLLTTAVLADRAVSLFPELTRVTCASGDKFVADPARKQELHEQFDADICEMEAAGIVRICQHNGIPHLLIKTVSDGIQGGAEEYKKEIDRSAAICLQIVDRIIRDL